MSKSFNNLKDLEKYLNQLAKDVVQTDKKVKKVVVDKMVESIDENVYVPYTPSPSSPYTRHKDNGGLTDPDNFATVPTSEGVEIYSTREGTDRKGDDVYVAEIIEGYKDYSVEDVWGLGFEKPRHFVEPAREKLRKTDDLKNAIADGLKGKRLDVK